MASLWQVIPDGTKVQGITTIDIMEDRRGKPVLRLEWGTTIVYITANQGELIGGAAKGARLRYEELGGIK